VSENAESCLVEIILRISEGVMRVSENKVKCIVGLACVVGVCVGVYKRDSIKEFFFRMAGAKWR
jgi:hypothetical protein